MYVIEVLATEDFELGEHDGHLIRRKKGDKCTIHPRETDCVLFAGAWWSVPKKLFDLDNIVTVVSPAHKPGIPLTAKPSRFKR